MITLLKKIIVKIVRVTIKLPFLLLSWLFVQVAAPFCYEKKYLKTPPFEKITSYGWRVAANDIIHRIIFDKNVHIPWPCSPYITCHSNIQFDPQDVGNFMGAGNYFQCVNGGKIMIGKGTYIARNVGIITANHDLSNPAKHQTGTTVKIGDSCWIGMNAIIMPGVELGSHTVVGGGSVVTHSFPEGNCVVAGCPATIKKYLMENRPYPHDELE